MRLFILQCFFIAACLAPIRLNADPVRFVHVTTRQQFDSLMRQSQETGTPLFVGVYAVWCRHCRMLEREVYCDSAVGDFFNVSFINVLVDGEKGFGKEFSGSYRVSGYPTLFFLDGHGEVLYRVNGYVESWELLSYARRALRKSRQTGEEESRHLHNPEGWQRKENAGIRSALYVSSPVPGQVLFPGKLCTYSLVHQSHLLKGFLYGRSGLLTGRKCPFP